MSDSTKAMLEAQLEALIEADGDAGEITNLISRIDSMGEEPVELTAKALAIEPTVVTPVEPQQLPIEKENTSMSLNLTKESLGIGGEFTSALNALDINTISNALIEVQDTDNLSALVSTGTSKLDAEHRIHVERRGEIRRAARGFALFAAGGVGTDGQVTSPDGSLHYVEDGVCYKKSQTKQPDSLSGGFATIERVTPCLGHLEYRKVGEKFEKTGGEYTRCLHQWALMFNAGYFITFSRELYSDVIITEIAQRVGDEDAREVAKAQIAEWQENRQTNFEERKAYAQAINHVSNAMGLPEGSRLPDVPEVLGYKLPDGRTMQEAILDLKGASFVVEYTVPVNGEPSTQRSRANSLNEIKSRMSPAFAMIKTNGGAISLVSVEAVA